MENYFNYFTEIEERFRARRGGGLLLSTLDWALIETYRDGGIPLDAVLAGIDATFDEYDRRPSKTRKVNSLAYCSQEIFAAAEEMKEAAVGLTQDEGKRPAGLEVEEIVAFLRRNAAVLERVAGERVAEGPTSSPSSSLSPIAIGAQQGPLAGVANESAVALVELARTISESPGSVRLEDLERSLTAMEERLQAALTVTATEAELAGFRAEAEREIAPYRSKMPGFQLQQLQRQFVHKRLFERATIPRLSLFYM